MQNAKDTFYVTLQSRLATLNAARTIVVRGVVRPGTLVDENELPSAGVSVDVFRLQWTGLQVNNTELLPLVAMECSIQYATDGARAVAAWIADACWQQWMQSWRRLWVPSRTWYRR